MRLRYLAAAGPVEALERLARALAAATGPPLERILDAPGLAVWTLAGTPSLVSVNGTAAAIGLLFNREGVRPRGLPSPVPPHDEFVKRFWGPYVLFAADGGGHAVLRDPSGGVGAYHRRADPLDLYASDAALLATADASPLEPDFAFVRQWLAFPFLRGRLTGAHGVHEILPGIARSADARGTRETLAWSPWDHTPPARTTASFDAAAAGLRDAIQLAVPCLAGDAGGIAVQLSGGLDSSIVAAALAAAGREFGAVTFATRAPDGDERTYARDVAQHCGIALAELVEDALPPDFERVPLLALRPPPNALLQPLHRALSNHFALTGTDLMLGGAGGDNVFCYLASASPALDALRRRGPTASLGVLRDLARLHDTTVWTVTRAAVRRAQKPRTPWPRDPAFLSPEAAATALSAHPWLEVPAVADRGSFEHVQSIVGIRHFLADSAPGEPAAMHPLLAQPVLEACLRVPSWLWVRGGRDRAVAREAFRDLLPAAILARRSKGRLESMFVTGYMARRRQLEAQLLEGQLARLGLLDRVAVLEYLRREAQPTDPGYIRLLELSAAEGWLRSFER